MLLKWKLISLDGLDLEVETNEGEHQAFQVLNEVVEEAQTFRVLRLIDVEQRPDFRCCERDVLVADEDFELLTSDTISWWPQ